MRLFIVLCGAYFTLVTAVSAKSDVAPSKSAKPVETKSAFKTNKQRYSYAIGQQVGKSINQQNIDIDIKVFMDSLHSAMKGEKSKLTEDEIKTAFMLLQKEMAEKQQKIAEQNKKTGEVFLAKNKKEKSVTVTSSGLQYKIITKGKGAIPSATDTVEVHYEGRLIDGTVFDSSYTRNKSTKFAVNQVIPGWTEALTLMPVGSTWELYIPADIAYGERAMASIPGNSTLIFKVELLNIETKADTAKAAKEEVKNKF